MNRARVGLLLAATSVLLTLALLPPRRGAQLRTEERVETARPALLSGLAFHSSQDGEAEFSFAAREIGRRRARLGPLSLNPFSELLVEDARIVIHVRQNEGDRGAMDARGPLDPFELVTAASPITDVIHLGTITRVSIRRFETRFVAGGNELVVEAREAELEPGSRKIDLRGGVALRAAGGSELHSRRATWRLASQSFEVHGPWELETRQGTRRGVGAKLAIRPEAGVFELVREGGGAARSRPRASASALRHAAPTTLR